MDTSTQLKQAVAVRAAGEVVSGSIVGLGSGSTLEFFIRELGDRVRSGKLSITGVPTSLQARLLARAVGIPVLDPMETDRIDMAVDGADEVDPQGNLIKGGGGAHVTEKIIGAWADRYVIVVDNSKRVPVLGRGFAVPVEVLAPALNYVTQRLQQLGATVTVRTGKGKVGPIISDLGNLIVDAKFPEITDPRQLDGRLNGIPGLVGHGLFVRRAFRLIVARAAATGPALEVIDFDGGG